MKKLLTMPPLKYLFATLFLFIVQFVYPIYFKQITIKDGLPHFSVKSIYQDIHGRMWFGTNEGLTIYDGSQMKVFKPSPKQREEAWLVSLNRNQITSITGEKNGDVFFLADKSLMKYDIKKQYFEEVRPGKANALTSSNGQIWCAYHDSVFIYDPATNNLKLSLKTNLQSIQNLFISEKKQLWIGTQAGLYVTDDKQNSHCIIPSISVYQIFQCSKKKIWVSTWSHGLFQISTDGTVYKMPYNPESKTGLSSNQIRELVEDNSGNLWLGSFNGLQKYNPYTGEFSLYKSDILPGSLSHSSVYSLYKDNQGMIWAGTFFGGVNYFNPKKDSFSFYPNNPDRTDCLNFPLVGDMAEDRDGNLWICTEGGGLNCLHRKEKTFSFYLASDKRNTLPHNNLKSICYDKKQHCLYISTHTGGLSRFDIQTKKIRNYLNNYTPGKLAPSNMINKIMCYNNQLIISATNGTFIMDMETEIFERIKGVKCQTFDIDSLGYMWMVDKQDIVCINIKDHNDKQLFSFDKYNSNFPTTRIYTSNDGFVYVGTLGAGIYCLNKKDSTIINYTVEKKQLLSNYCYNITQTNMGNLLITSDKDIMLFNPATQSVKSIQLGTGIPLVAMVQNCGILVGNNHEIFVGGTNGLVSFWEETVEKQTSSCKLYFTDMLVDNMPVLPDDKTNILQQSLPFTQKIYLNYKQNNLTFKFTVSNYIDIQKSNRYEYKLEGFNKEWNSTSNFSAHYTNLNPGKYTLKIREFKLHTNNPAKESSLDIIIYSPWYNTIWAWLFYMLSGSLIIYFIWKNKKKQLELAMSLREERNEKERIEILNQAKLRFFTNISHEFRTPLTLILSHIDILLQNNSLSPGIYNKVQKVYKHAYRMRSLITELLDFRKFDQQQIILQVSEQNIVMYLKDIYYSFSDYADQHNISYHFHHNTDKITCWFDSTQMQKVFFNLLSNAFKYTPEGGSVELTVTEDEQQIFVKVIDNGIGLTATDKEHIFDRFYQADNAETGTNNTGTGIGLTLTKSIVLQHHAEISVESKPGYGSIFIVTLKKGQQHFNDTKNTVIRKKQQEPTIDKHSFPDPAFMKQVPEIPENIPEEQQESPKYTIVLVEDNEELMQILIAMFSPFYHVISAFNGEDGLEKITNENPDLVVSDVMMPVMTGIEMCLRIKKNIDLCHIPVILLSALNSDEQNMAGLKCGANDYIGKPFNAKLLLLRCNNLIQNRLFMQNDLIKQENFNVNLLATNPLDKKFLDRIVLLIEENLDKKDFDVNSLAKEMALGRSSFFTKFKAMTGITPSSFILDYKLKKAATMLISHPETQISEIADLLAFNSPQYFCKCFKAQFNLSPLEYRKSRLSRD